ncbi:MAG: MFS transporter [bacterium]|nr:MFS transporter [bacterium]
MTRQQRSILLVAMVSQGIAVGLTMGILPVFLEPLEAAFEAPRTAIAGGQILIMFSLTGASLVTGSALDKGHARVVMLVGVGLLVTAMLIAASSTNLLLLALAALFAGAAVPPCGPITAASLVARNFDAERGRAVGLASMGPPLGSGLFAALAGWLLGRFAWNEVFLVFAGIAGLVLVPLIWSIVPMRYATETTAEAGAVNMRAVLRNPAFLWAGGLFALATGIVTGWTVHTAAFVGGAGFSEAGASRVLAVQFWMGVPGAVLFGMLADRTSLTTLFVAMLGTATAVLAAFAAGPGTAAIAVLCTIMGFVTGGMIPLYMVLLSRRLGPDAMGRAMGLSNLLMLPIMATTVLLAASVFESTGRYVGALAVFAFGLLGSIGCLFGSNREAARRARSAADVEVVGA